MQHIFSLLARRSIYARLIFDTNLIQATLGGFNLDTFSSEVPRDIGQYVRTTISEYTSENISELISCNDSLVMTHCLIYWQAILSVAARVQ